MYSPPVSAPPVSAPPVTSAVRRPACRPLVALLAACVAVGSACAPDNRVSPDEQAQLADGAHLADSLAAAAVWDDAGVVALGYIERLHLGLGSPFRLAEQAAADPRLPAPLGRRTAWALLNATLRGRAYAVDSATLGVAGALAPGGNPDGGWHRALIDSAVSAAPSARTGEEAVRVAYALARAEGLVTPHVAQAAVNAAALARDRRLATYDARRLLAAARVESRAEPTRDALLVLSDWRVGRRFLSEMPLLADALAPDPAEAVRMADGLLARMRREGVVVRAVSPTVSSPADTAHRRRVDAVVALAAPASAPRVGTVPGTLDVGAFTTVTPAAGRDDPMIGALPTAAARRLANMPSARAAYPSAPIVVTLGGFRHTLVADTLPATDSTAEFGHMRARLAARARTEELLAAEWAMVRAELRPYTQARRELAALVQAAAIAVRPWAQAPAVGVAAGVATNPNGAAAEVDAVRARDGYRAIGFDAGTPPEWRAAAARQLGDAVADLRGVFLDVTLDGLAVRVGESPRHDLALALHEPATRTVYLPAATGAGTVAHELVHDLDWQAARARLATRGGYRTDHLARAGSDDLAQAVRSLGGSRSDTRRPLGAAAPGTSPVDADRPAERLARGADFFVAAALAHDGRANGVLSAVQDPVLTGYAGVVAPEPGDGSAESLMEVLGTMTRVPATTRAWFLARFGDGGVRSPLAVAQFALGAQPGWEGERVLRVAGVPGGLAGPGNPGFASACGGIGGGTAAPWQARLVWLAADARARGFVRARAVHAASAGGAFWGWTARAMIGGPWQPEASEAAVARVRDAILRAAMGEARRAGGLCAVAPPPVR